LQYGGAGIPIGIGRLAGTIHLPTFKNASVRATVSITIITVVALLAVSSLHGSIAAPAAGPAARSAAVLLAG